MNLNKQGIHKYNIRFLRASTARRTNVNRFNSASQLRIFLFYNILYIQLDRNSHAEIYYSNHIFPYLSYPFRLANFFLI